MERVSTCLLQVIVTETNGTETEMLAIMLPVRSWVFINSLQWKNSTKALRDRLVVLKTCLTC